MSVLNSKKAYGSVTKSLHWLTALLVIALLAVGLYMTDLPNSPDKFKIYAFHKSIGITVLTLTLLRVLWHRRSAKPEMVTTLGAMEKKLSKALHEVFYVLLAVMPLTGWALSSAVSFPVSFFGLFTLPPLLAPNKELVGLFKELHDDIGIALIVLVALHALASLKHHFIDKDAVLKRMLP